MTNKDQFGIPQGSPISDVIANCYLMEFDEILRDMADQAGGYYYRYSDDILLLMPTGGEDFKARLLEIQSTMEAQGSELRIHDRKSSVFHFYLHDSSQTKTQGFDLIFGEKGKNGLEYLGFRFTGKGVYLRDSTISGLNRKVVSSARRQACLHFDKHPHMNLAQLQACFDYKILIERFGRIKEFEIHGFEFSKWTFFTYVKRSLAIFGSVSRPIVKQMARQRAFVRQKANLELAKLAH